jgi:hypothetical protein
MTKGLMNQVGVRYELLEQQEELLVQERKEQRRTQEAPST